MAMRTSRPNLKPSLLVFPSRKRGILLILERACQGYISFHLYSRVIGVDGEWLLTRNNVQHFESYPPVADSIKVFKSNHYGQQVLSLANASYSRFLAPFVPYARGPYGYVAPYVNKADELGDSGLSKFDEKVPIFKEDTEKIKQTVFDYAFYPLNLFNQSRQHATDTYFTQYDKMGGNGVLPASKALVTTSSILTSETIDMFLGFFRQQKETAQTKSGEMRSNLEKQAGEFKSNMEKRGHDMMSMAQQKGDEAKTTAERKGTEAKSTAEKKGSEAKSKGENAKSKAGEKIDS